MCSGPRNGQGRTQESKAGYKFDINAKFNNADINEKIIEDITDNFISANQNLEYRESGAA